MKKKRTPSPMSHSDLVVLFADFIHEKNTRNASLLKEYGLQKNCIGQVLVEARTGGSSGGNCWDNAPSHGYTKDDADVESEIMQELAWPFSDLLERLGIARTSPDFDMTTLRHNGLDTRTQDEYYGNYTSYELFGVDIAEVLAALLTPHQAQALEEALAQAKAVADPAYAKATLLKEHHEVSQKLMVFDKTKAQEKKSMAQQLKNLQERYDRLDEDNKLMKSSLLKQLSRVNEGLKTLGVNPDEPVAPKEKKEKIPADPYKLARH